MTQYALISTELTKVVKRKPHTMKPSNKQATHIKPKHPRTSRSMNPETHTTSDVTQEPNPTFKQIESMLKHASEGREMAGKSGSTSAQQALKALAAKVP